VIRSVVAPPGYAVALLAGGFAGVPSGVPAHADSMPVRLHHIVVDAHDPPGPARFWTQAPSSKALSEREREIVIGTGENAPIGMCFMPVADRPDQQRAGPRPGD
jgi:hypothetical protein